MFLDCASAVQPHKPKFFRICRCLVVVSCLRFRAKKDLAATAATAFYSAKLR